MPSAAEIAQLLSGEVVGDASVTLKNFAPADAAKPGDLTFAENEQYLAKAEQSAASAILVGKDVAASKKTLIRVANPRVAFARVLPLFSSEPTFAAGIHATAVISASAAVDPTVHIGPHCVVGERTVLGAGVVLQGGNHVGADCVLGENSNLFPNVVVYPGCQIGKRVRIHAGTAIGADGFGYVLDAGAHRKVPQIGNVVIGEHCIVVSQTGIAGSTKLGSYTVIGGQVGLAGHLKIGNKVTISAQSGVMHDIPDGEKVWGTPAQPDRMIKRQILAVQRLPELLRRVAELEKKLGGG